MPLKVMMDTELLLQLLVSLRHREFNDLQRALLGANGNPPLTLVPGHVVDICLLGKRNFLAEKGEHLEARKIFEFKIRSLGRKLDLEIKQNENSSNLINLRFPDFRNSAHDIEVNQFQLSH